jgi:hypothetical protein
MSAASIARSAQLQSVAAVRARSAVPSSFIVEHGCDLALDHGQHVARGLDPDLARKKWGPGSTLGFQAGRALAAGVLALRGSLAVRVCVGHPDREYPVPRWAETASRARVRSGRSVITTRKTAGRRVRIARCASTHGAGHTESLTTRVAGGGLAAIERQVL